jgi:hypothetical protein
VERGVARVTTTAQVETQAGKRQVHVEEQISYKKLTKTDNEARRGRNRADLFRTGSHWRYYHTSARQQTITGKHNKEPGRSVRSAAHCDAMTLTQSKPRSE